jgi:hypothetical protein
LGRRFTLPEANRLIPDVERIIRGAIQLKPEFDQTSEAMRKHNERLHMLGGAVIDRTRYIELKTRRDEIGQRIRDAIGELNEMGVQVKDLDMGLVDFPTLYRGEEVYLCWKFGEDAIRFWHGDEGFKGRKPIDQDFLDNHEGERTQ